MINPHIRHSLESGLWLAGLRAGVELAKTSIQVNQSWQDGAFEGLDWDDVDEALKKLEDE